MPKNYSTIHEADIGNGIDAEAPLTNLQPGFFQKLENVDIVAAGGLRKRKGFQVTGGSLPLPVVKAVQTNDTLCLSLPDFMDFSNLNSRPITVRGRISTDPTDGEFGTTETEVHYPGFISNTRKTLTAPSGTATLLATEHSAASPDILVVLKQSDSATALNNSDFLADDIQIDSSLNIDVSYVIDTDTDIFIGVIELTGSSSYVQPSFSTLAPTGTTITITIPQATHQLPNSNIIPVVWEDLGGGNRRVLQHDSFTIKPSGDVIVTFESDTSLDLKVGLLATPLANEVTGTVLSGETLSITIPSDNPFLVATSYLEPVLGGDLEQVLPNSVIWNDGTLTVEFINEDGVTRNFSVFYQDANIGTSILCVTAANSSTWTEENPDLHVWGLLSEGDAPLSLSAGSRALWTHWLDTYSSQAQKFPVAAVSGSPVERQSDSVINLRPRMSTRLSADKTVAPAFGPALGSGTRRVEVTSFGGFLNTTSITFTTGNQQEILISAPAHTINSLPIAGQDRLTIEQATYPENRGTFEIVSITAPDANSLLITIENPNVEDDCWDEDETGALCGIFTDTVELLESDTFIEGDELVGQGLETLGHVVIKQMGTTLLLDNVRIDTVLPGGLRVRAIRTLSVLPLEDQDGTDTTSELVPGDSVKLSLFDRHFRILDVHNWADKSGTLTNDGSTTTITVADTTGIREGATVALFGDVTKEVTITEVSSITELTYAGADTGSVTLRGKSVVLDETLELDGRVSVSITRPLRWFPIPAVSYGTLPKSLIFTNEAEDLQPVLKSTMARDSLFCTNQSDAVQKFDSTNMMQAGLPRWETMLFLRADTDPANGGRIAVVTPSLSYASFTGSSFTISGLDNQFTFVPGQTIRVQGGTGTPYVIREIGESSSGTDIIISVDRTINASEAASGDIVPETRYSYYARLNMVDANGGLVASAVVGSATYDVVLDDSAGVELKLLNFPRLGNFDYDRLELQIFRTRAASPAGPYYRLTTIPLKDESTYVTYRDSALDETLIEFDEISTSLQGVELGTQWDGPLRASHITNVGGRLALANCVGWPSLDLTLFRGSNAPLTTADMNGFTVTLREDNTASGGQTFEFTGLSAQSGSCTVTSGSIVFGSGPLAAGTLATGEYVYLFQQVTDAPLKGAGWHQATADNTLVDVPDASYIYTVATDRTHIPVFQNLEDDSVRDWNWPFQEKLSSEGQAMVRLAGAINWWQATLSEAWLTASAGGDFGFGQIVLKQPKVSSTIFEVELDSIPASLDVFANGLLRDKSAPPLQISAFTSLFPSRVLLSEVNFPEIFNIPDTALDVQSRNVVDVNPDDGQEITGLATFFGVATTSAAQKQRTLVVFKENSIHVLDTETLEVQKLETEGKGCSVPSTIVSTKGGIQFANSSGIYRLTPSLDIQYVGRKYEGEWRKSGIDTSVGAATYWKFKNRYLLSHVVDSVETAAVFDTTREAQSGRPSISTYTGLDSLMWSNLDDDLLFASKRGLVLVDRKDDLATDYRDEHRAIETTILSRPHHFGDPAVRKVVGGIISHYRVPSTGSISVEMATRVDIGGNLEDVDSATVSQAPVELQPLSYLTIRNSPSQPRGNFFQIQWINSNLDEEFELATYSIEVAGMSTRGVLEAAST